MLPVRVRSPPRTAPLLKDVCLAFARRFLELYDEYKEAGGRTTLPTHSIDARSFDAMVHSFETLRYSCVRLIKSYSENSFMFLQEVCGHRPEWNKTYGIPASQIHLVRRLTAHLTNVPQIMIDEFEREKAEIKERREEAIRRQNERDEKIRALRSFVRAELKKAESEFRADLAAQNALFRKSSQLTDGIDGAYGAAVLAGIADHRDTRKFLNKLKAAQKEIDGQVTIARNDLATKFAAYRQTCMEELRKLGLSETDPDIADIMFNIRMHS